MQPDDTRFAAPHPLGDLPLKSVRAANYPVALRSEMLALGRACGVRHPALIGRRRIEVVAARYASAPLPDGFGYESDWPLVSAGRRAEMEGADRPPRSAASARPLYG